jgi:hypothetical protein
LRIASLQLGHGQAYPVEPLLPSLQTVLSRLDAMKSWSVSGAFDHRLPSFNPGFSPIAVDPGSSEGFVIVGFHAVRGRHSGTRMHIERGRSNSSHWYDYWIDQFEHLWNLGRSPTP